MDISTLERAAEVVLAPPNIVADADRKAAEALFQEMKVGTVGLDVFTHILQNTNHQFVLYQVSQAIAETVLKQWAMIDGAQVQETYRLLLQYVATNENLATYVISDFLRTVAIIVKRGILDGKSGDQSQLHQLIKNMITDASPRLQSIGCQLIYAITEQFATAWRNAHYSITWDFHVRAKAEFEKHGLRGFLEMALETLVVLCAQPDILGNDFYRRLCEKFLEVAETIFSWNFSTKIFRRFFAASQSATSFRPPRSWEDLVMQDRFLNLFFELHSHIRRNEDLALRSLSCLAQLASLSGDVMSNNEDFAQSHVNHFVESLVETFKEGPLPYEVNGMCMLINRLFVFRPIQTIMRLPEATRQRFFMFFSQYMQHLTNQAVAKAIGQCDHGDHASLAILLESWVIMLRGRWRVGMSVQEQAAVEELLLLGPTQEMVNTIIMALQAPPFGTRPPAMDEEGDDDDDDDRELFKDIFNPFSTLSCYTVNTFMNNAALLIHGKVQALKEMMNTNLDLSKLQQWQEDMHWVMLLIANSVVSEDVDGTCSTSPDVFEYCVDLCESRGAPYDEDVKQNFLRSCLLEPMGDRPVTSPDVDPFISLLGQIFAWCAIESDMIANTDFRPAVSPELCRSSILCLRRFINASTHIPEDNNDVEKLPLIQSSGPLIDSLTQFVIRKVFLTLQAFSGEHKLGVDAVDLLTALIDTNAARIARDSDMYQYIRTLDLATLPSRMKLMTTLVMIAAEAEDTQVQQDMYSRILVPLIDRFHQLCAQPATSQTDAALADLLQCFDGVAQAGSANTAIVLAGEVNLFMAIFFGRPFPVPAGDGYAVEMGAGDWMERNNNNQFLNPLLDSCVPLMTSRAHCQPIITTILQLLLDVTTKVCIYLENDEKNTVLYNILVAIVTGYAEQQRQRLMGISQADEEEKATDLVTFMEILANVLSKDILDGGQGTVATGAQVVMKSLEMLVSIMNENILKIPDVAQKFYRLILYLVEFSPEAMQAMSADLLSSIFQCLRMGIVNNFGLEICSLALEALTEVGMYMAQHREVNSAVVSANLREFMPLVFESCLDYSCENSLFTDACSGLYALICFDKDAFEQFVMNILNLKSNKEATEHLRAAFVELLPAEMKTNRASRLDFRRRMEKLLNKIQGLLTLP